MGPHAVEHLQGQHVIRLQTGGPALNRQPVPPIEHGLRLDEDGVSLIDGLQPQGGLTLLVTHRAHDGQIARHEFLGVDVARLKPAPLDGDGDRAAVAHDVHDQQVHFGAIVKALRASSDPDLVDRLKERKKAQRLHHLRHVGQRLDVAERGAGPAVTRQRLCGDFALIDSADLQAADDLVGV